MVNLSYIQQLCPVLEKQAIGKNIYDLTLLCPEMAAQAKPGQFVHIRVPGFTLRRPISICEVDPCRGTFRLVFEVRGDGTRELAQISQGENLDIMGPLGHGFTMLDPSQPVLFVGGGIGVPPLLEAAKHYGEKAVVAVGFRTASAAILVEDFKKYGCRVMVATDDGTMGHHGVVTDLVRESLAGQPCSLIGACGPKPMLKGVMGLAAEFGVPCEVSLEERMGCGVGACLVCACKTKREDGSQTYSHVCKDGPVFPAEKVVLE